MLGHRRPAQINPRGDGTFDVVYYPDAEGPLKVDVLYGGKPVRDRWSLHLSYCLSWTTTFLTILIFPPLFCFFTSQPSASPVLFPHLFSLPYLYIRCFHRSPSVFTFLIFFAPIFTFVVFFDLWELMSEPSVLLITLGFYTKCIQSACWFLASAQNVPRKGSNATFTGSPVMDEERMSQWSVGQ